MPEANNTAAAPKKSSLAPKAVFGTSSPMPPSPPSPFRSRYSADPPSATPS